MADSGISNGDAREFDNLKSQFVISSWGGARRARPYAFTEQGVAMLSTVLNSERAVQVNIEIMRAFVRLREVLATNRELSQKLVELERRFGTHDEPYSDQVFMLHRQFPVAATVHIWAQIVFKKM